MFDIKISVIIPVYNISDHLTRCLNSVCAQSLKEIEIIVVNDGSTDNSLDIIKEFQSRDVRIVLLDKVNGGLSSARNAGLAVARGEYIQHIDGDDWVEPDYLESTYRLAKAHNLDLVGTNFYWDNDDGSFWQANDVKLPDGVFSQEEYLKVFFKTGYPAIWAKLIKRSLYADNNITHPLGIDIGEDMYVTPRLIYFSERIGKINKAFVHYIQRPSSIMQSSGTEKLIHYTLVVLANLEDFFADTEYEKEFMSYKIGNIHYWLNEHKNGAQKGSAYQAAWREFVRLAGNKDISSGKKGLNVFLRIYKYLPNEKLWGLYFWLKTLKN